MSYKSQYTGPQIDEALSRGLKMAGNANGWIKLESSLEEKYDLNTVITPGNYVTEYWTNGPEDIDLLTPINFSIYRVGDGLFQGVMFPPDAWVRQYNEDAQTWGSWVHKQYYTVTNIGDESHEPKNPENGLLWFEMVTDPDTGETKVYPKIWVDPDGPDGETPGKWLPLAPEGMMTTDVYDTNGEGKDIFKLIEELTKDLNHEEIETAIQEHIEDETMHVTEEQLEALKNVPTAEVIDEYLQKLKEDAEGIVRNELAKMEGESHDITDQIADFLRQLNEHVNNSNIHPTPARQSVWDSKANGDHTHILDGRVKISASDIVDGILDPSLIDDSAKEIVIKVDKIEDAYVFTTKDIQNGDMLYVVNPREIYFVKDDSKLLTEEEAEEYKGDPPKKTLTEEQITSIRGAYQLFSADTIILSWNLLEDKPTDIAGFGITDAYTKEEVDERLNPLEDLAYTYESAIENLATFNDEVTLEELIAQVAEISPKVTDFLAKQAELEKNIVSITSLVKELEVMLV